MSLSWQTLSPLLQNALTGLWLCQSWVCQHACIAQTDGCACNVLLHSPKAKGGSVNGVHVLYCHVVLWIGCLENFICYPYMYITLNTDGRVLSTYSFGNKPYSSSACVATMCFKYPSFVAWLHEYMSIIVSLTTWATPLSAGVGWVSSLYLTVPTSNHDKFAGECSTHCVRILACTHIHKRSVSFIVLHVLHAHRFSSILGHI